jgi:glycosyltransferase involved in cell wall biosynthesis
MTTESAAHWKTAAVISLYFSCAHASHMMALGKLLNALGFAVTFILDEKYLSMADFAAIGETVTVGGRSNRPGERAFDLAVVCNCATRNHVLVRDLRAQGASVFYLFHEPGPLWSWSYFLSEGCRQTIRFVISSCFNIVTVRRSTAVIVHSSCALALYEQNYLRHNSNVHAMPLLFDDEIGSDRVERARHDKRFFGFVGTACKSHGFDVFVSFAKFAIGSGSRMPFSIATKVDLSSLLAEDRELARLVREGRIRMQHGRGLSNDEINLHYLDCFCVWAVYRRSTQSGVMANAFMAGSPVIATRVGSFPEYVVPGVNGEFVDSVDDFGAMLRLAEKMRRDIPAYSAGSRKTFLDTFYYGANRKKLTELLRSFIPENELRSASLKRDFEVRTNHG